MSCSAFRLGYLDCIDIKNKKEGLEEPSGLARSHEQNALWTISDDTGKIFKLNLNGDLIKDESFEIPIRGLEGITTDPTGKFLFVVQEEDNEIIKIEINSQKTVHRQRLAKMTGYEAISKHFSEDGAKKGIEGITWNNNTGTIFVLKERTPGLLLEISSDLRTIISHQELNRENGFHDNKVDADELDFSDLYYDSTKNLFWIISDEASKLFVYDNNVNQVLHSCSLKYEKKGKKRKLKKAEGITILPELNQLYIVCDEEAKLYLFEIQDVG